MTQKYLIILIFTFSVSIVLSQSMSNLKALDIPQKFVLPAGDQTLEDNESVLSGNIWEVFSDRIYNKTTNKPSSGGVFKVLQYLDRYYVYEIKKKYLHLVKDQNLNSDGTFSESSEDYGWISAENLLLWRHCLVDSDGRNKRVFIFKNQETEGYFADNKEDAALNTADYFQVLHIIKEEKDRSLLSKPVRLFGGKEILNDNIIGWVNNDNFVTFSSNIFAEPHKLVSYMSGNSSSSILNPIFIDKKSIRKSISGKDINPVKLLWSRNINQKLKSTFFRFPIIAIKDSIAEVLVYYPDISYQVGQFNIETEFRNEFYKGYCSLKESQREISYNKVLLFNKTEVLKLLDIYDLLLRLNEEPKDSLTVAHDFRDFFQIDKNITNSMILNMTLESLFHNKFGCCYSNRFNRKTVKALFVAEDRSQFGIYVQIIKENLRQINAIYNNNNANISFLSNGSLYYWLSCSYVQ